MLGYAGVKRLAEERKDWLPLVKASLECAKEYKEFAGSWVLSKAKVKWVPGLRSLATYGILKRIDTSRGGRRAYYIMPDPEGVEKALRELGVL